MSERGDGRMDDDLYWGRRAVRCFNSRLHKMRVYTSLINV